MVSGNTDLGTADHQVVPQARALVQHLFRRKPALYWLDFLLSMAVVYLTAWIYFGPGLAVGRVAAGILCGGALFRAGMFIHELQHTRRRELLGFKIAWNLIYGIPMLMPSFMYANHRDHHNVRTYGTAQDSEYTVFVSGPLHQLVLYFLVPFVAPLAILARFLVLAPASLLYPPLRRWVLEYATLLGNFGKPRAIWPDEAHTLWALMEAACFLVALGALTLATVGIISVEVLAKAYALFVLAVGLNAMRDFTAHRFRPSGGRRSLAAQLADSINITGKSPLSYLAYPIGMRYHALHHLFPSLPYHNMGKAHRLLMAGLPANSVYRKTIERGFFPAAAALVGEVLSAERTARAGNGPAA